MQHVCGTEQGQISYIGEILSMVSVLMNYERGGSFDELGARSLCAMLKTPG